MMTKNRAAFHSRKPTPKPRRIIKGWKGLVGDAPVTNQLEERFVDYLEIPETIDVGVLTQCQASEIGRSLESLISMLNRGDEAIQQQFGNAFDGKWSEQSRSIFLKDYLKTGIPPFGEAYTVTPPDWRCPCCHRIKPGFVRKTAVGRYAGDIVNHHDHAEDHKFVPRFFGGVHVCSECNEADARAKLLLSEDSDCQPWFTFKIDEIRQFITTHPNRPHVIDGDRAYQLMRMDHRFGHDQEDIANNCDVAPLNEPSLLLVEYKRLYRHLETLNSDVCWPAIPLRVLRAFWRKRSIWKDLTRYD